MKTIEIEGRNLRYWDPKAASVDEKGQPVLVDSKTEKNEDGTPKKVPLMAGAWVIKPTKTSYEFPESHDEVLKLAGGDETRLCALVAEGLKAEAEAKVGTAPEGTFSKAMASSVTKMLMNNPEFRGLARAARTEAVMRSVSQNESNVKLLLGMLENLRTSNVEENDEE